LVILLSLPKQFFAIEFRDKFEADFEQFAGLFDAFKALSSHLPPTSEILSRKTGAKNSP